MEQFDPIPLPVASLYVTILSSWQRPEMPGDDQYYHSKIWRSTVVWSQKTLPGDLSLVTPSGDSLLQRNVASALSKDQDEVQGDRAGVALKPEDVMILVVV